MLSSLMELFSLSLCLWQRQCNPIRYWQTQCNQATRQSECDSPLRGQSHSLCLLTSPAAIPVFRAAAVNYGIIHG